jgi:hypothetical protein
MDVEEIIRAQPMDSVVLIGGCDKTVPAQLMGAASADLQAIQLVAGPMSTGRYQGERLGACTDCRRYWAKFRAGEIDEPEIDRVEARLASTTGTCAVTGTASTMASIAEAIGMMPAPDQPQYRPLTQIACGWPKRRAVFPIRRYRCPENHLRVCLGIERVPPRIEPMSPLGSNTFVLA